MKQILTLIICLGAAVSGIAQTGSDRSRDVILGRPSRGTDANTNRDVILGRDNGRVYDKQRRASYPGSSSEADAINRDYDAKVQSIRNNGYLTAAEKERAIRQLNADRAKRLKEVKGTYKRGDRDRNNNRDWDRDDDDDDRYKRSKKVKGNNGNHYGWEKGKGNERKGKAKSGKYDK